MKLVQHHDLTAFAEHVRPWLMLRECENCYQLGLLSAPTKKGTPDASGMFPLLMSVETNEGVVGVGFQEDPFAITVTRMPEEGIFLIAQKLTELKWPAAGVVGPVESVDPLTDA